ncbi:M14 family metallopeptidase [Erythrobacter oryzae]|uniref:M14 family metallopeptidase n=1 Tax=Erythrobacter oryzae TaxID=3019556 RepID=UPI0025522458|nr:M14 family metallopeptidase [Erythrobacter sp. COR-2]
MLSEARVSLAACRSASVSLHFDFDGAAPSACAITGERAFELLVTPEHAPPINPSPWYAFRYEAEGDAPVSVTLRYLGAKHRYDPKWSGGGESRDLAVEVREDGAAAQMTLPPGGGIVSAREVIAPADARADLDRWSAASGATVFTLGTSHDGRPIEAIRLGRKDAPRLVVLLGRQHPPEVTGAIAMRAFVDALVEARSLPADVQILIVPMLNPDGTARGHWRANRGATDLNRDWGPFTQPETRAVKAWLDALPQGVRPVLMVDFHSTRSNLFYVQSDDEMDGGQRRFLAAWLAGQEAALADYPFTIERRNANPGSGTAKNWFHAVYAIPAYTYEVADTADRAAIRTAARALAGRLAPALEAVAPGGGE